MADTLLENPILHSPSDDPERHWRSGDEGITADVNERRRVSAYFVPVARTKKADQMQFESEWTADRIEENTFINQVRERVGLWRKGGSLGITLTTRRLLEYWQRPDRGRRLFYCQIGALGTAIYTGEVIIANAINHHGDEVLKVHDVA